MIPNFYYYLVSTFPQVVFIVFIFLVYRYISRVRKGRQTKFHLPKDQSISSEQSGYISNHLSTLLPNHIFNHHTNSSNEASNVSIPGILKERTDLTVNSINQLITNEPKNNLCIPPPPKFDPKTHKFDIWIDNFESYMNQHDIWHEAMTWTNALKHLMSDSCKEKIIFLFQKPGATYDEIKKNISLMYGG